MNSYRFILASALLVLNIIFHVHSAPLELNELAKTQSIGTSSKLVDGLLKKVNKRETFAEIRDKIDDSIDKNKGEILDDLQMNTDELQELTRKRRMIQSNDQLQRREKRSLSPFDFYDTNPLYGSSVRPTRSFESIYWYDPSYTRSLRSVLEPSFYEPSEWNRIYPETLESDETENDRIPFYVSEDEDGYNRYPILFDSSVDVPYDNLKLQQEYNTQDGPIDIDENDDNDDNGEYFLPRFGPFESYYK